jgi:hypothetical protein
MPGAVIRADQLAGAGVGADGVARKDLWAGQSVTLNVATFGNTSYTWELLARPFGSTSFLVTPTASVSSFTPDLVGSYRVRLTVNGGGAGNVQTLVYRVRFDNAGVLANRGWAYPAFGETDVEANYDGNQRGWAEDLDSILEDVRGELGSLPTFPLSEDDILPGFSVASFAKTAPNTGTLLYRRGDTLTSITASESYVSGPPASASIVNTYGGSSGVGDIDPGSWVINSPYVSAALTGSILRNGSDLGSDPTMVATLTATKPPVKTAAFTISWTRDVYYGVGAAGFSSEAQIEALAGTELVGSRQRTFVVSPSTQKVYYAYPKAYGAATFTLGGFSADFNSPSEISVTNVNGVTSTYYLYESVQLLTGSSLNFVVT